MHETFWSLLKDAAHWEFEIFLMVLFDLVLGGLLWPFLRKHWLHHAARDRRDREQVIAPYTDFIGTRYYSEDLKKKLDKPGPLC